MIPEDWNEVLCRMADVLTWRHWAEGRPMDGITNIAPDERRRMGYRREWSLAWSVGLVEAWNPDPNAWHNHGPDVWPNMEVRPGRIYTQADRPHQKADPPGRWVVGAAMMGNTIHFRGWLDAETIQMVGTWDEAKGVWFAEDRDLKPMNLIHDAIWDWWDHVGRGEWPDVKDHADFSDTWFWRFIEWTPQMEEYWAAKVKQRAGKRGAGIHAEAAVKWATTKRGPFPDRASLLKPCRYRW